MWSGGRVPCVRRRVMLLEQRVLRDKHGVLRSGLSGELRCVRERDLDGHQHKHKDSDAVKQQHASMWSHGGRQAMRERRMLLHERHVRARRRVLRQRLRLELRIVLD